MEDSSSPQVLVNTTGSPVAVVEDSGFPSEGIIGSNGTLNGHLDNHLESGTICTLNLIDYSICMLHCQGTKSTKSLSRWLRPHDMLYTLTRPLTQEPIGLEMWKQHKSSSNLALNIPL